MFPLFPHLFAMKWWGWMPWSLCFFWMNLKPLPICFIMLGNAGAGGRVEILAMPAQVSSKHERLHTHSRNGTLLFPLDACCLCTTWSCRAECCSPSLTLSIASSRILLAIWPQLKSHPVASPEKVLTFLQPASWPPSFREAPMALGKAGLVDSARTETHLGVELPSVV